jgi:hypothetical protein
VPPGRFYNINKKISTALTDNKTIPQAAWAANPELLPNYLAMSKKHDELHHTALLGGKLDISQRDLLQEQLTLYLDEIALVLEAAAVRNPDILVVSGFDLAKERRSHPRTKATIIATEVSRAEHPEQP